MTSVVCFLAGAVAALALWPLLAGVFRAGVLQRENYRGHRLPVATGLVIVLAVLVVEAGQVLLLAPGVVDEPGLSRRPLAASGCLFAVRVRVARLHRRRARRRTAAASRSLSARCPRADHHRLPEAVRRAGRGGRGAAGVRVAGGASWSTRCSSRWPPTSATSSTARRAARSSAHARLRAARDSCSARVRPGWRSPATGWEMRSCPTTSTSA